MPAECAGRQTTDWAADVGNDASGTLGVIAYRFMHATLHAVIYLFICVFTKLFVSLFWEMQNRLHACLADGTACHYQYDSHAI